MTGGAVASTQVIWTIRFSRRARYWTLLFLVPLVVTATLSTIGLALPSKTSESLTRTLSVQLQTYAFGTAPRRHCVFFLSRTLRTNQRLLICPTTFVKNFNIIYLVSLDHNWVLNPWFPLKLKSMI